MDDLKPYFRSRPRSALDRIERPRLAAWFTATRHAAVRLVCAPLGSGKTCAVQQYADAQGGSTGYVRIPAGAGAAALRGIVAQREIGRASCRERGQDLVLGVDVGV